MSQIRNIHARQILDSRGNPTLEVDIYLGDKSFGRAAVPSGASTGEHEAVELRDNNTVYCGKSVNQAVENVNQIIAGKLVGMDAFDITSIDATMLALDGTENKGRLGANAILGVSMATVHAAAVSSGTNLFEYLHEGTDYVLPTPMMNILNGGSHADNNVDIQEFMIFPVGANSFSHALQMGAEIFHQLKSVLKKSGLNTNVGDEGGFAPDLKSNTEAIELLMETVSKDGRNKLVLVDGHAVAFHSWYSSYPQEVIPGFMRKLAHTVRHQNASHLMIAFDPAPPTFRHKMYPPYKGNRPPVPEEFLGECRNLFGLLDSYEIPHSTAEGFEADDVLGMASKTAIEQGFEVFITTTVYWVGLGADQPSAINTSCYGFSI